MAAPFAPLGDGLPLRRRPLFIHFRIAVLSAEPKPLEEFAASGLACGRRRKEYPEPQMIRILVTGAENPVALGGSALHPFAAARARADQNEAADQIGRLKRNLLADESAHRKTEHIDFG